MEKQTSYYSRFVARGYIVREKGEHEDKIYEIYIANSRQEVEEYCIHASETLCGTFFVDKNEESVPINRIMVFK